MKKQMDRQTDEQINPTLWLNSLAAQTKHVDETYLRSFTVLSFNYTYFCCYGGRCCCCYQMAQK